MTETNNEDLNQFTTTITSLIFPWNLRKPLWTAIRQVLLAPFVAPTFFLIYVGDVFTRFVSHIEVLSLWFFSLIIAFHLIKLVFSMIKVFQDILWSLMFVISGDWMLSEKSHHHKGGLQTHEWADS